MRILKLIIPAIFSISLFIFVLINVPAPNSWQEASTFQILAFIIPLLFMLLSVINLFSYNLITSFLISLGVIILIGLKAAHILNYFSTGLVILIFGGLVIHFKGGLTKEKRIPKLTPNQDE